jgi:D-alanine-D-alanine ligase-like ATP-grasp enzyme
MTRSKLKRDASGLLGKILVKIAPKIGAEIYLEPEWNVVGQIKFRNGKKSYFRYNTLDLNPMGASEIARDKDYSNFFMESLGFPIIPKSKTFYSDKWANTIGAHDRKIDDAYRYALKIGFPVIVKPNSCSQGYGVSLVSNKEEFYGALKSIFERDKIALVQQQVKGKDYRIVVLDNKIISAYQRIPLNVVGNDYNTIKELLLMKQEQFKKINRDTKINIDDSRIRIKLQHQGLTIDSIPKKDDLIFLLDNANLSTGGNSMDVTDKISSFFREISIRLTKEMGLRLCGVDLMIDGDISDETANYWVIEINSAPGLDHYSKIGTGQEKIVESLYLEVLKHLEGNY